MLWKSERGTIKARKLRRKTETDITADYTDTIGYDYQCPEVLPRKIRTFIARYLRENL